MKGSTILLVEDAFDDFTLMERAFRKTDLLVHLKWVNNAEDAIAYLTGTGEYINRSACPIPDLILSDLKMPRMDGLDLLQWVKSKPSLRNIPFVLLTASKERSDLKKAYELGANSFLTKPSTFNELVEVSAALKTYWLKFNLVEAS